MSVVDRKGGNRPSDWVNLVLGIALAVSPWILGYSGYESAAAWNAAYAGGFVAVIAFYAIANFAPWNEWCSALAGIWVLLAPWAVGFAEITVALWMHVAVGAVVTALAVSRLWQVYHHGDTGTHAHA